MYLSIIFGVPGRSRTKQTIKFTDPQKATPEKRPYTSSKDMLTTSKPIELYGSLIFLVTCMSSMKRVVN